MKEPRLRNFNSSTHERASLGYAQFQLRLMKEPRTHSFNSGNHEGALLGCAQF